jgi:arylsulfatase A-like enzyme
MDRAIERLTAAKGRRVFMHMHFLDAHYPYNRALTEGEPFDRYIAELGLVDKEIQRLRRALQGLGLTSKTAILISSDHGEAFGEHRTWRHAVSVYDELLRVPLFVIAPGITPRSIDVPVSLIDLGPTILDLMGLPTPGIFMGQSLEPFLRGQDPALSRPVVADSSRLLQAMLFAGDDGLLKIIRDKRRGTVELYNLTTDPGELQNLYRESDPASRAKIAMLNVFFQAHTLREGGYSPPFGR